MSGGAYSQLNNSGDGLPMPASSGTATPLQQQQQQQQRETIFHTSAHPIALAFFLVFRFAAILTYLLGLLFTSNFVLVFMIVIFLLAFDFWTVKNISGRLLVGLRWWNETSADGKTTWIFESKDASYTPNATDSRVFWTVLYAFPILWILLAFVAILKFEFFWLTLVVIALILNMANVMAYTRCDKDAKQKWATGVASGALYGSQGSLIRRIAGTAIGRLFG